MSPVLPQLERALLTARAGLASLLAVAVVAGGALLLLHHRGQPAPATAGGAAGPPLLTAVGPGRFAIRDQGSASVYPLGGRVYLGWEQITRSHGLRSELARIDPVTGTVLASVRPAPVVGPMLIDGALWSIDEGPEAGRPARASLVRSDPVTLKQLSSTRLSGSLAQGLGGLVQTGSSTWVSGRGGLDRFDSASGRLTGFVAVPDSSRASLRIWSDRVGGASALYGHIRLPYNQLQRRDPRTGALVARDRTPALASNPTPSVDGRSWIHWQYGQVGTLDLKTLAFRPAYPRIHFQTVQFNVTDGILFVDQTQGGPQRNFCADPATGRIRATLPLARDAEFLAADATDIYSLLVTGVRHGPERVFLDRNPIPAACRG
jgi:hypothetical protein